MRTIKVMIAVKEAELIVLRKVAKDLKSTFSQQKKELKVDAKKYEEINSTIATISGFASNEMILYFGYWYNDALIKAGLKACPC